MTTLQRVLSEMPRVLPGFHPRKEQTDMMEMVYTAMKEGKKAAIHAPTGTGKSFGYLLPFVAVKLEDPSFRILISTFTISLQEQLKKDIQIASKVYQALKTDADKSIQATVFMGKSNYFCSERFVEGKFSVPSALGDKIEKKVEQLKAARSPLDRQHLGISMTNDQWGQMNVDTCLADKCSFHMECPFFQDHFLAKPDIAIVNHSLFLNRHFYADRAWEEYHFHTFDESHKLEKCMYETAGFHLSMASCENWVYQAVHLAQKKGADPDVIDQWTNHTLYENPVIQGFKTGLQKLGTLLGPYATNIEKLKLSKQNILQMVKAVEVWQSDMAVRFKEELVEYEKLKKDDPFKEEVDYWMQGLGELNEFSKWLKKEDSLLWTEKENQFALLKITPGSLQNLPTPFTKGTLLTSGTLAEKGSVLPFAKRLHIQLDLEAVLPTPFQLKERTLVYISQQTNPKKPDYEQRLAAEIKDLITCGEMKTFVLFTSTQLMGQMHKELKDSLTSFAESQGLEIEIWLQNKTNHQHIMNSFRNPNVRTILFGTLTYFEGIDLKEKSLTQVILTRLPFSPPDHPVQELLNQHHNYSLWEASIRFEQAFGRLIRTHQDYGTFCILDSRVTQYPEFTHAFREEQIPVTSRLGDVASFYRRMEKSL